MDETYLNINLGKKIKLNIDLIIRCSEFTKLNNSNRVVHASRIRPIKDIHTKHNFHTGEATYTFSIVCGIKLLCLVLCLLISSSSLSLLLLHNIT